MSPEVSRTPRAVQRRDVEAEGQCLPPKTGGRRKCKLCWARGEEGWGKGQIEGPLKGKVREKDSVAPPPNVMVLGAESQ
jgi:hypothetical protein